MVTFQYHSYCTCLAAITLYTSSVWAFQHCPTSFHRTPTIAKPHHYRACELNLFGRNRAEVNASDPILRPKSLSFRIFGRGNSSEDVLTVPTVESAEEPEIVTAMAPTSVSTIEKPEDVAARLRSDAEKMRLEAQLMDAELTLKKIKTLERKLAAAQNNTKVDKVQLQQEIDLLSNKMSKKDGDREATPPAKIDKPAISTPVRVTEEPRFSSPSEHGVWRKYSIPFVKADFEKCKEALQNVPDEALRTAAEDMGVKVDPATKSFNKTEVFLRFYQGTCGDFSFSPKPIPYFSDAHIDSEKSRMYAVKEEARKLGGENGEKVMPPWTTENFGNRTRLLVAVSSNSPEITEKELAQLSLEHQHYCSGTAQDVATYIAKVTDITNGFLSFVQDFEGRTDESGDFYEQDTTITTLMPKSITNKKELPTKAEVQKLMKDVLPKAKFSTSSEPTKVLGGWILRGTFKGKDGNEFTKLLDAAMAKNLEEKLTVSYLPDFTAFSSDEGMENLMTGAVDPILYVTGPDPARESRPVQLALVTSIGIATSWYLSLYPFLLNTAIASRVDEELALLDAGMSPDLNWLTDLTLPLFSTFIAIQLTHELGHFIAAKLNGIKTYPPTFVPSVITGITSSVTSLKSSPKNLAATFDFAIAGPIAGILASLFALLIGSRLSLLGSAMYPALPLEILRQSTLGGGIIDGIIGGGTLNVPNAALGTAAVAQMTVPLHPMAVAGYIGLIVNSLSLLPVGTTDGGRVALALFGRGSKSFIGSAFMIALFVAGFAGSDLFLFYFSFVIAFETGNEIPARNEVDTLDLPRVCLAAATYFVAALALIPFQ